MVGKMDDIQLMGNPVAITKVVSTFEHSNPTTDSLYQVIRGGSLYHRDGMDNLPLRNLGKYNVKNNYIIDLSTTSTIAASHGYLDRIQHSYTPTIIGDFKYYRTANNVVRFHRSDKADLPLYDESSIDYIDSWKAVTEQNNGVSFSKPKEFKEFTIAMNDKLTDGILNKYVTEIYNLDIPFNDMGKALSMTHNLKNQINNYLRSPEGIRLAEQKSLDGEKVSYLKIEAPSTAVYSITRLPNGKVRIATNNNSYNYLSKLARSYGLKTEDLVNEHLGEEFMHLYRKSFDKRFLSNDDVIREELATKEELLNFYINEFEGAAGNENLRSKYRKIIKILNRDIETTPERYSKIYNSKSKENKEINLEEMLEKVELEDDNETSILDELNDYEMENKAEYDESESDYETSELESEAMESSEATE